MNDGASLSRFKNTYRLRYCTSAGLEEPPELQPGQNVLSAIQNYFDDSESDIEADTLGIGNTSTPVSEISSRFAVSDRRSSVHPTFRASSNFPTPKSIKSGVQDDKVNRRFTPPQKLQSPSSANGNNIQEKILTSVQIDNNGSASESDSDESHINVDSGAILLAPEEDATNIAPNVKGPLNLSRKFYKIDGSVIHDLASPTIRLPTKKRLSFRNATLIKEGNTAQDNALKLMNEIKKNVSVPVKNTCTADSLLSTIVPSHPTSHFVQGEEEDEFMIHEEDSGVLDTWLGMSESNSQKEKTQPKEVASKSEIRSPKKETTVKGKRKYQVQSSTQNNDKQTKEDIPPAKQKRALSRDASKQISVSPDRHLVSSEKEQFAKGAKTLTPEPGRKTAKGHLRQVSSLEEAQQECGKNVASFEHSEDEYSDAIFKEGENPLKAFPEKWAVSESAATAKDHNASSAAYVNNAIRKESICLQSPASKQRADKTSSMPSDFRTIQTPKKNSKKSSNLADVTHLVERPVSSMFLQAATLGHTDSRIPPMVPDLPPTPLVHQDKDDEEFVIDESLFVPNPLVSIPRVGKRHKQLVSESERGTDIHQAKPIVSSIVSNDGYNDKEHISIEEQQIHSREENDPALSEREMLSSHERPLVETKVCVKLRPSKGGGRRNKKTPLEPVVQSYENAKESSYSEGERAMQKKTSAKLRKQKVENKKNVMSIKSKSSKGNHKNKRTPLEPIVQSDENTNDSSYSEGEHAMQKKTQRKKNTVKNHKSLKKRGQNKASSALAPLTVLPNENYSEQNGAVNVLSVETNATELCRTSTKNVLPLNVNNECLLPANKNIFSSLEDKGLKKSKRRKQSSDDEPIPSTSDGRHSGRSLRTHKPPGNWWAVTSPVLDKTLDLRKETSPKGAQKTSPKKIDKSKKLSTKSKQGKKNHKQASKLSDLPDSQSIDDAVTAKDAFPNENNAVNSNGAKKNQKSRYPNKIVSSDESNIKKPLSIIEASQGLPSSKPLGKQSVAEENDNQDKELPVPQKIIKSILKTDTKNRPALLKETILNSLEESEDNISIGKVSSVQQSKKSHVTELRKSIMPGDTQENAINFRSSLASFGAAYIKSPHVQNIFSEDCAELQTEEALLTGSLQKSPKQSGSPQTPKRAPPKSSENVVLADQMHEVLNFEDHPLVHLHSKVTPRAEQDEIAIGSGPSLKRSVEFINRDGIPATSEVSDTSEFEDDNRKYNVCQRLVLPSNTPNVRRSRRTRVKPLQYWRGERVNYLSRPSGRVVDGIIPPSEKVQGGKATAKRKHMPKGQAGGNVYERKVPQGNGRGTKVVAKTLSEVVEEAEKPLADNTGFQLTDHTTVLDHAKGTEIQVECVRFAEDCVYSTQKDSLSVTKALRNSMFSVGKLKIGPLQQKGYQFVCLDTIVFYIIHGLVEVTLHVSNYHLKAGDYFFVPPGNMYNIRNLKSEEAVLIFTQIKGSPMFVEESE